MYYTLKPPGGANEQHISTGQETTTSHYLRAVKMKTHLDVLKTRWLSKNSCSILVLLTTILKGGHLSSGWMLSHWPRT